MVFFLNMRLELSNCLIDKKFSNLRSDFIKPDGMIEIKKKER